jgi:predicted nucleic acid-binding protein
MARTVIYDANVLFPAPLRDLLIRIALTGVIQARWTDQILDECFRNILKHRPELTLDRLARTRTLMNRAVRDVLVVGYEHHIQALTLPDVDDRHVLAAAIHAGAQVIVTFNLKDFPSAALSGFGVEAKHPDYFIAELIDLDPDAMTSAVQGQADALKNPPTTLSQLLDNLAQQGLTQSVSKLRSLLGVAA